MTPRDLTELRAEYITGNLSLREIARKYGIPERTVQDTSGREGWVRERREYRQSVVDRVKNTAAAAAADKLAGVCVAADMMVEHIESALADREIFRKYVVRTMTESGAGEGYERVNTTDVRILDRSDTKSIRDMVEALQGITATIRNLYDIPTQAERHAQQIAAGHLRVAQARSQTQTGAIEITINGGDGYAD